MRHVVKAVVKRGTLQIQVVKTQNLLLDPRIIKQGIYRRMDATAPGPTKKRLREQLQSEAGLAKDILGIDPTLDD